MCYCYAGKWSGNYKEVRQPYSVDTAREKFRNGESFTVLVGSPKKPSKYIVFHESAAIVEFLDERLREYLTHHFKKLSDGRFFLTMAVHREFDGHEERPARGTTFRFEEDGSVLVIKRIAATREVFEAETTADVSGHYSDFPEFGDFEDLLRRER